jgi:hypothetical protein
VIGILRDLVRSFSWRFETLLASAVGWLVLACWLRGDRSPLDTLDRAARWLGVDISNALANIDAWMNADHRQAALIVACQILFSAALLAHADRLWNYWPAREAAEKRGERQTYVRWFVGCEIRFWSIAWVLTGVLAVLKRGSWGLALAYLVVILVVRGIVELRDHHPDPSSSRDPWLKLDEFRWSMGNGLHWAILVLAQLPLQLYEAVLAPSVAITQRDRKGDDESASPD